MANLLGESKSHINNIIINRANTRVELIVDLLMRNAEKKFTVNEMQSLKFVASNC